jgi:hypothetical protein
LRRHYRGGGDEVQHEPQRGGPKRAGLLTDRKGRRVLVERFGEKKPELEERKEKKRFGGRPRKGDMRKGDMRKGRTRRPDRARGPRPSRPRERE